MGEDEASTLDALKAHRKELIEPRIVEHRGRVVKLSGDGVLAEFPSVVEAVQCAAEIQWGMAKRNADVPADRRIDFRLGINLGDVIVDGEDLYGDGVNVAARLEGLADPGGVCVARNVFNQVKNKLELGFEDLGEHQLKNIDEPVCVYRIDLVHPEACEMVRGPDPESLPLPNEPSVAVLPFENMSDDSDQAYFAHGVTENIITGLTRFQDIFVIAVKSSFAARDDTTDVQQIGRHLGVAHVVEGSLRKAGNRVRVTVQLIDAARRHRV